VTYLLAGDATYDETLFKQRIVDGPASDIGVSLNTMDRISVFAQNEPARSHRPSITQPTLTYEDARYV
jgi:hypothetical protein